MSEPLPELLDARKLAELLGVKQYVAYRFMEKLPKVRVPGVRKVFVKRDDVQRLIDENTTKGVG